MVRYHRSMNWLPIIVALVAIGCSSPEVSYTSADSGSMSDVAAPDSSDIEDATSPAPDADGVLDMREPLRDDGLVATTWRDKVLRVIDSEALPAYFAEVGYTLPAGSAVYGVRLDAGAEYPSYQFFDAGGGAFDLSFWPASTIKLLSALGAYLLGRTLGVSVPAAILVGLIFAFAPARFFRMAQVHVTTIPWMPSCLAFLHAYFSHSGRPCHLRLAAFFYTAQALTSGHGAVFLTVASVSYVAYRLVLGERLNAVGRQLRASTGSFLRRL